VAVVTAPWSYRGRRARFIENEHLRVSVLEEGGHVAEILDKATGVNPLWTPVWPSVEPSAFDPARHTGFGNGPDARLLAGIMGHSLCLDIFGGPSAEEAQGGLTVHGEGSVAPYHLDVRQDEIVARAHLALAGLRIERHLALRGRAVRIHEAVTNLSGCDRPVGWTQHVTLGPPFLEAGVTEFRASATRSKVYESAFGTADYLEAGAVFDWPMAPRRDGGAADLQQFPGAAVSGAYTAHLMDPGRPEAFFVAFSPRLGLAFGYVWNPADFPWLGIWEEHLSRTAPPWNGVSIARGMEFGVSPFPESRRQMIERGTLFGERTYRWIPAYGQVRAEYLAFTRATDRAEVRIEDCGL
jgi:hypothetical protein